MPFSKMNINAVRDNLPTDLQEKLIQFEKDKAAYTKLQEEITEAVEGARSPVRQAEALERQANAAEVALKDATRFRDFSQDEISAELARIETIKKEAQELRFTAQCREGKAEPLSLQLVPLRSKLEALQYRINTEANNTLISQILNQPGMRDTLLQLFALVRSKTYAKLKDAPILLERCIDYRQRELKTKEHVNADFVNEILQLFDGAEKETFPPQLAILPALATGEKKMSPAQLHKQRFAKLG